MLAPNLGALARKAVPFQYRLVDDARQTADIWRTERLLLRLGYGPPFAIKCLQPSEPDVAVETPEGTIGIELTEH